MPEQSVSDLKLVQHLNEAYGLEKRLESTLRALLAAISKPTYKKRVKQHLVETKRHSRELKARIKQLGGVAHNGSAPGPEPAAEAAQTQSSDTQQAAAPAAPASHAPGLSSDEEEQLKAAETQYAAESEEIAIYMAIEALAETLEDKETLRVVRAIRREEERMRSFLEKEIPRLSRALGKAARSPAPRGASPSTRRAGPGKAALSKTAAARRRAPVVRKRQTAQKTLASATTGTAD
jgi:ferritin-like metal-binding protein YciE